MFFTDAVSNKINNKCYNLFVTLYFLYIKYYISKSPILKKKLLFRWLLFEKVDKIIIYDNLQCKKNNN